MSERLSALDPAEVGELQAAGILEEEIVAVDQSIVASRVLAVKSFVDEANDNTLAARGAVRRESHGKHQGCLRAKFEVTTPTDIGIFRSGATFTPRGYASRMAAPISAMIAVSTSRAALPSKC